MTLKPIISNRDGKFALPPDGWVHLVPRGEYPISVDDQTFTQVIDDAALSAMQNRLAAEAGNVRMDFDHFSYDPTKSSEASGWIDESQVRADGLWAKPRWSDIGEAALVNGRYRFLSPSWLPKDVESLGDGRIRPLRLDSAGLTNNPNMRGMAPLTNRDAFNAFAGVPADNQNQTKEDNQTMKTIAIKLGLSADAAEPAVLAEIDKLTNRATTAESDLAAIKPKHDILVNRVAELLGEQIDADIATAGITDETVIGKLKPVLVPMKNRAERVDFLALMAPSNKEEGKAQKPLTNRETAKTPGTKVGEQVKSDEADSARAVAIRNRANTLSREEKISFTEAWRRAEGEFAATK